MTSKIIAVEPYYGESHKDFLDGLIKHSRHDFQLITLPAKHWQWRMRTAAFELHQQVSEAAAEGGILFTSDYVDLPSLLGFIAPNLGNSKLQQLKKIHYFHENQISYPVRKELERDVHFALTNILSCHAADEVWFNSGWHLENFLSSAQSLNRKFPDHKTLKIEEIKDKCLVVPLGVELPLLEEKLQPIKNKPIKIIWNHRWEYDKDPETFFAVLAELQEEGLQFELSVCGLSFDKKPDIFSRIPEIFGSKLSHFGWLENKEDYYQQLRSSHIVVSTAKHEFFGISTVEALNFGCYPLLPNRLNYPELIPSHRHDQHLWIEQSELKEKLRKLMISSEALEEFHPIDVSKYSWVNRIKDFDTRFENILN